MSKAENIDTQQQILRSSNTYLDIATCEMDLWTVDLCRLCEYDPQCVIPDYMTQEPDLDFSPRNLREGLPCLKCHSHHHHQHQKHHHHHQDQDHEKSWAKLGQGGRITGRDFADCQKRVTPLLNHLGHRHQNKALLVMFVDKAKVKVT